MQLFIITRRNIFLPRNGYTSQQRFAPCCSPVPKDDASHCLDLFGFQILELWQIRLHQLKAGVCQVPIHFRYCSLALLLLAYDRASQDTVYFTVSYGRILKNYQMILFISDMELYQVLYGSVVPKFDRQASHFFTIAIQQKGYVNNGPICAKLDWQSFVLLAAELFPHSLLLL